MPRPRRSDKRTVRLVAYVHPDTLKALRDQTDALGIDRSIGAVLDAHHQPRSTDHQWVDHALLGRVCSRCHQPPTSAPRECPGERTP